MRGGRVNLLIFLLMAACLAFPAGARADVNTESMHKAPILVQGEAISLRWPVVMEGQDIIIPAPDLAVATGSAFKFYLGSGKIEFTRQGRTVNLTVDSPRMSVGGGGIAIPRPRSVEGVVYVPLQPVVNGLGGIIKRNADSISIDFPSNLNALPAVVNSGSGVDTLEKLLPPGGRLAPPTPLISGEGVVPAAIYKGDLDQDGTDEHVAVYKTEAGRAGVVVYREKYKSLIKIWQKEESFPLSDVVVADLNGGGCELLLGWMAGASAGSSLQIYTWMGNGMGLLHNDYFHRLDVGDFDGDGTNEFATWAKDTGTSFAVTVNDWDGKKFSPLGDCPAYYEKVVRYYQDQINTIPGARFLVYYLADAYLRAGNADHALKQAGRGLSMSYGYPPNRYFYRIRGEALRKQEKYKEAVAAYKIALEDGTPGTVWSEARYGLAVCYRNTGENKLALAEITRALNEGNDWAGYSSAMEELKKWQEESFTSREQKRNSKAL